MACATRSPTSCTARSLAREAGYDGVEIMGSEGYFINEFLAPRTNQRNDEWGGSLENRARLALEIVRQTRAAVGRDFIIIFRISGLDLVEGGCDGAEVEWLASQMEGAGATMLNTGIGWHEARMPTIAGMVPRGAFGWVSRAHQGGDAPAGDRHQPHQCAARSPRRCSRSGDARPGVDGAAAARGSGSAAQGARGPRRRDQHLHRLQPGLPRPRLREPARHLPGESARGL